MLGGEYPACALSRSRSARGHLRRVSPTPDAQNALRRLLGSTPSYGGKEVTGRNVLTVKRSKPRPKLMFKPLLRVPAVGRGRHPTVRQGNLYNIWHSPIGADGVSATKNRPFWYSRTILELAHSCFKLAGAPKSNITRLINERALASGRRSSVGTATILRELSAGINRLRQALRGAPTSPRFRVRACPGLPA